MIWHSQVVVIWTAPGGLRVRERAETEVVNAHGALLRLGAPLYVGKQLQLVDPRTSEARGARVVWSHQELGNPAQAGVELAIPSETFWGLYIPLHATVTESS